MTRRRHLNLAAALCCTVTGLVAAFAPPAIAASNRTYSDPVYDAAARRTDATADGPIDPDQHRLVDLVSIRIGKWSATNPAADRFSGGYSVAGSFVRVDLTFDGLVNPPGPTTPEAFAPFAYGPDPVYGFVEFDLDESNSTGGELDAPRYRYLANVGRFGGIPVGDVFDNRVARSSASIDASFATKPWVERSGEEFHLALLGELFDPSDVSVAAGDADGVFEPGETWDIRAAWFHCAHGFERYSLAEGGPAGGEYMPQTILRFASDTVANTTTLSFVFPLTNAADAALRGEATEADDFDPSNQSSIHEALSLLVDSAQIVAMFGSGEPEEALILPWQFGSPDNNLDPTAWRVTALVGTSYTAPDPGGALFVWTDVYPNVQRGDVDGEHGPDADDRSEILDYIESHDEDDHAEDGSAPVADFGTEFTVYDLNQDGRVDSLDVMLVRAIGDDDEDGDVDLADFAHFQACLLSASWEADPACVLDDVDADGEVTLSDYLRFAQLLAGP